MSKRATEMGIAQGIALKHNAFTQHMKDWTSAVLLEGVNDLSLED